MEYAYTVIYYRATCDNERLLGVKHPPTGGHSIKPGPPYNGVTKGMKNATKVNFYEPACWDFLCPDIWFRII